MRRWRGEEAEEKARGECRSGCETCEDRSWPRPEYEKRYITPCDDTTSGRP
ncbi:hypothetical protein ALC60_06834 [Trachymyrmex zeteki]|uniref:Uncharacterized protein n=1 Tax=Mycetomoellerius zeteki TaxID=64791 RepID=A0A151X241_9HYME|nr:hypothetical protein ALC60_06834 [Trachymyrmex zeteki]